jgi:hypothetical protein
METTKIRTCFVAAPFGARLEVLRDALISRGIRPLIPEDLTTGSDWASEIQHQLEEADLVVGILPNSLDSAWILFELGQAWALGRQIILIAPPDGASIPFDLRRCLTLRTSPNNSEAINFALDQLLLSPKSVPTKSQHKESERSFQTAGLGGTADALIERLGKTLDTADARGLEAVIADAIRLSGTDVVVESPQDDRSADLAVWSDVLAPFIGNPLLVEIKLRIRDRGAARKALESLFAQTALSGARWALFIYGEGPQDDSELLAGLPTVLSISALQLLTELRHRSFPEIVRDLRNQRVHGVRP